MSDIQPVVMTPAVAVPTVPVAAAPMVYMGPKNSLGTAGMVCAIIAAAISWVPGLNFASFPLAILGLIFGAVGLARANKLPGNIGKGKSIAALVLSVIGLALPIIFIFAVTSAIFGVSSAAAYDDYSVNHARHSGINPIAIIIPLLLLAGAAGFWFYRRQKGEPLTVDSMQGIVRQGALRLANASTPAACEDGHPMPASGNFCQTCGKPKASIEPQTFDAAVAAAPPVKRICNNGHMMKNTAAFCGECGSEPTAFPESTVDVSGTTNGIIAEGKHRM